MKVIPYKVPAQYLRKVTINVSEGNKGATELVFYKNRVFYKEKWWLVDSLPDFKASDSVALRLFDPKNRMFGSIFVSGVVL